MLQKNIEKMTLKKIWKLNRDTQPLLGNSYILSTLPFMEEYSTNYAMFDRNLAKEYGYAYMVNFDGEYEDEADAPDMFRMDSSAVLFKYKKELQRLWDASLVEFNPIENYDRMEESTDTRNGSNSATENFGEQVLTDAYGGKSTTEQIGQATRTESIGEAKTTENIGAGKTTESVGEQTVTTEKGAKSTTNEYGAHTSTVEKEISASGVSGYSDLDKTTTTDNPHTDTTSEGASTDTQRQAAAENITSEDARTNIRTEASKENIITDGERSNTITESEKTDTHTAGAKQDEKSGRFEEAAKHQSRIHGNIGVMTATTALKEFTDWYTSPKANFYEQLFKIIVNELCYYTEEV